MKIFWRLCGSTTGIKTNELGNAFPWSMKVNGVMQSPAMNPVAILSEFRVTRRNVLVGFLPLCTDLYAASWDGRIDLRHDIRDWHQALSLRLTRWQNHFRYIRPRRRMRNILAKISGVTSTKTTLQKQAHPSRKKIWAGADSYCNYNKHVWCKMFFFKKWKKDGKRHKWKWEWL